MDNGLMNFELMDKVDEYTRKVLLKRLKEIGVTIDNDNNMKQLEHELSIVKHMKDVDK